MKLCQECHERPAVPGNRKYCRECAELVRLRKNREAAQRYHSARCPNAARRTRTGEGRKCLLPLLRAIHSAKPPVLPWSEHERPECAACEWRRDGARTCILPRCMKCRYI